MFKSVVVVNVVAERESVIIGVDCVVVSRVAVGEAKVIIEIHMKTWYGLTKHSYFDTDLYRFFSTYRLMEEEELVQDQLF